MRPLFTTMSWCAVLVFSGCMPETDTDDEPIMIGAGGTVDGAGGMMAPMMGGIMAEGGTMMPPPPPPEPILVPEFGRSTERHVVVHARRSNGLSHPRDLAFDPDAPANLWVVDRDWDGNIILHDAGSAGQRIDRLHDMAGNHFMEEVSGMAFSDRGSFGTCQESRNSYDYATFDNDFMGPSLWSTDLMIHCTVNQTPGGLLNGSHLDMLHQSPNCMGMAHQEGHAFFITDGANGHVVRYDFREPHCPGCDDHSDGEISRYPEMTFTRVPNIPSHLVLEGDDLYYVDTGTGSIKVGDVSTGRIGGRLEAQSEPLAVYNYYEDVSVRTFAEGLDTPSGLVVAEDHIFVSFPLTGEIAAFDRNGTEIQRVDTGAPGVMGLTMGPQGRIWFVNAYEGMVGVIDPGPSDVTPAEVPAAPSRGDCAYPAGSGEIGVGHVMPPYTWDAARQGGGAATPLSALDMFCGDDWADVSVIIFVMVAEWVPWIGDYLAYVDALSPLIEESGGRIVFVGAQDRAGRVLNGTTTNRLVDQFAPQGSGIRVGEREGSYVSKLMDSGLVDHLPSAFVVRRSDMRVLATQRTRTMNHLPYVEMARDPDADWSNPGTPTFIPTLPSNCEDGDDEASEPNDTPDQAAPLEVGSHSGGVCARRGDFYSIDIEGPWTMEVKFRHAVGDIDVVLFDGSVPLMDRTGNPVGAASSDDNETVEWRGPATVYIYGFEGATSPYRLVLREG